MNTEADVAGFDDRLRRALLDHYDAARRALPWRDEADPYRIWVSEMMLQQTRVQTALTYYERWMGRFPTLEALADAELDDVLKAWEGLGYYARARNLHRAARIVRERHAGELPRDPAALRNLPGVGDYTAGAVASIAYGARVPALDGNARRVLCRLLDRDAADAELRRVAERLVPADRPGDFNQALMELGATICTPRSPRCDECPVAPLCRARAAGTQALRPGTKRRPPVPTAVVATAVVIDAAGRVLLARRPEDGLLGGLWEFPSDPLRTSDRSRDGDALPDADPKRSDEAHQEAARRVVALQLGGSTTPGRPIGEVTHAFSHLRVTYRIFVFHVGRVAPAAFPEASDESRDTADVVWAAPEDLDRYALPAAQRKIAGLVPIIDVFREPRSRPRS